MAKATSREDCVRRHEAYEIDVATRVLRQSFHRERVEKILAPVRPGDRVLDVGCNSGYTAAFLPTGCYYAGVDASRQLVEKARAKGLNAYVATAEELPLGADTFDVVILGEILEHVHDPQVVLAEAKRVGRTIVGSTPTENGKWGKASLEKHRFHVRAYSEAELRAELAAADLRDISIVPLKRYDPKTKRNVAQVYVFAARR